VKKVVKAIELLDKAAIAPIHYIKNSRMDIYYLSQRHQARRKGCLFFFGSGKKYGLFSERLALSERTPEG
jgi:hypothetical protein